MKANTITAQNIQMTLDNCVIVNLERYEQLIEKEKILDQEYDRLRSIYLQVMLDPNAGLRSPLEVVIDKPVTIATAKLIANILTTKIMALEECDEVMDKLVKQDRHYLDMSSYSMTWYQDKNTIDLLDNVKFKRLWDAAANNAAARKLREEVNDEVQESNVPARDLGTKASSGNELHANDESTKEVD